MRRRPLAAAACLTLAIACADDMPGKPTDVPERNPGGHIQHAPETAPRLALNDPQDTAHGFNPPSPIAPADGVTIAGLRPTFSVNTPPIAGVERNVIVEFQIGRNRGFDGANIIIRIAAPTSGPVTVQPPEDLTAGTRYFWRTRAIAGSRSSRWSAVRSFRMQGAGGGSPDPPDTPDRRHSHEDLDDGHFHRTLVYGDGYRQWNPDTEELEDCERDTRDRSGENVRCIDHRYWLSDLQNDPESLRIVVDTATVWRQTGVHLDREGLRPDDRCQVSDLRTRNGDRFTHRIADRTGQFIREATGRTWIGSVHYRRPGAWTHPSTVVVRFVRNACGENAAACATVGPPWQTWGLSNVDGGEIFVVIDENCRARNYTLTAMDELYAHELGHVLGFWHPDTRDNRDEMGSDSYDGRAGFSAREQRYMRHAYAHGRGWRGSGGRHIERPDRGGRRPRWIVD